MMHLLLQIENIDRLPDGGPVAMPVTRQIWHVGRSAGMDWVLPDPSRMISGHHFDVHFADGAWWLTDRSTNGTFLLGSPYRLSHPHRLAHQDRFQVGKYIVMVLLNEVAQPGFTAASPPGGPPYPGAQRGLPPAPMPGNFPDEGEDPWSLGGALPPVDLRAQARARPPADFVDEFIPTPQFAPPPVATPAPPAALKGQESFGEMPAAVPFPVPQPPVPQPVPTALPLVQTPSMPPQPVPQASPQPRNPDAMPGDFVTAFCAAAGLDASLAQGLDPATFGQVLGEIMRGATTELMSQLKLRAAARKFTRSTDQTMRQAQANNPLKFLPGPEQALESILFRPRAGFLTGAAAVGGALEDLRHHHIAVFAALQPALIRLLEDLSPDAVETASGGKGFLASARKVRAWDTYVQAWDAKAHAHENGMLDAFLALFAEAYQEAMIRQRGNEPD